MKQFQTHLKNFNKTSPIFKVEDDIKINNLEIANTLKNPISPNLCNRSNT